MTLAVCKPREGPAGRPSPAPAHRRRAGSPCPLRGPSAGAPPVAGLRKLGVNLTCDPNFASKNLFVD